MSEEFSGFLRFGAALLVVVAGVLFDLGAFNCPISLLFVAAGFVLWSMDA